MWMARAERPFRESLRGGNLLFTLYYLTKLDHMASDYNAIRAENQHEYGAGIGRIGHMLLANRYADRTHFIFELLQNAEDALSRRRGWHGSRAVTFTLESDSLRVSHFGEPFNEADVRGICGIGESTKDFTAIDGLGSVSSRFTRSLNGLKFTQESKTLRLKILFGQLRCPASNAKRRRRSSLCRSSMRTRQPTRRSPLA
jgi:hypothetical protein